MLGDFGALSLGKPTVSFGDGFRKASPSKIDFELVDSNQSGQEIDSDTILCSVVDVLLLLFYFHLDHIHHNVYMTGQNFHVKKKDYGRETIL